MNRGHDLAEFWRTCFARSRVGLGAAIGAGGRTMAPKSQNGLWHECLAEKKIGAKIKVVERIGLYNFYYYIVPVGLRAKELLHF